MTFRSVVSRICYGLLAHCAFAQNQPTSPSAPAPFTAQLKKAIVFVQTDCKDGSGNKSYAGTGFFVSIPEPRVGPNRIFSYLITNRHVVQPGIEDSKPCDVAGRAVRLNLKAQNNQTPSSQLVSLGADGGTSFSPSDDAVDLAALPVNPDTQVYDLEVIPTSMFANQTTAGFVEGDPVLFAGLFIQYSGRIRMQPIVRSGSIAMIPDESLPTTLKKQGHVYLTEVHAFGGNSGSPVFVDVGGLRKGKLGYEFKLLGVVAGEVFETADFQLQINASFKGDVTANSGISIVVPADQLRTLLDSPELQKLRDDEVARETQKKVSPAK